MTQVGGYVKCQSDRKLWVDYKLLGWIITSVESHFAAGSPMPLNYHCWALGLVYFVEMEAVGWVIESPST